MDSRKVVRSRWQMLERRDLHCRATSSKGSWQVGSFMNLSKSKHGGKWDLGVWWDGRGEGFRSAVIPKTARFAACRARSLGCAHSSAVWGVREVLMVVTPSCPVV